MSSPKGLSLRSQTRHTQPKPQQKKPVRNPRVLIVLVLGPLGLVFQNLPGTPTRSAELVLCSEQCIPLRRTTDCEAVKQFLFRVQCWTQVGKQQPFGLCLEGLGHDFTHLVLGPGVQVLSRGFRFRAFTLAPEVPKYWAVQGSSILNRGPGGPRVSGSLRTSETTRKQQLELARKGPCTK